MSKLTAYGIIATHYAPLHSALTSTLTWCSEPVEAEIIMPSYGPTTAYLRAYALSNARMRDRKKRPDSTERDMSQDLRWPLPNPQLLAYGKTPMWATPMPGLHIIHDHTRQTRHALLRWMFQRNPATGRGLKRPKLVTLTHAVDVRDMPLLDLTSDHMAPAAAAQLVQFCRARQWFWDEVPASLRDQLLEVPDDAR